MTCIELESESRVTAFGTALIAMVQIRTGEFFKSYINVAQLVQYLFVNVYIYLEYCILSKSIC